MKCWHKVLLTKRNISFGFFGRGRIHAIIMFLVSYLQNAVPVTTDATVPLYVVIALTTHVAIQTECAYKDVIRDTVEHSVDKVCNIDFLVIEVAYTSGFKCLYSLSRFFFIVFNALFVQLLKNKLKLPNYSIIHTMMIRIDTHRYIIRLYWSHSLPLSLVISLT